MSKMVNVIFVIFSIINQPFVLANQMALEEVAQVIETVTEDTVSRDLAEDSDIDRLRSAHLPITKRRVRPKEKRRFSRFRRQGGPGRSQPAAPPATAAASSLAPSAPKRRRLSLSPSRKRKVMTAFSQLDDRMKAVKLLDWVAPNRSSLETLTKKDIRLPLPDQLLDPVCEIKLLQSNFTRAGYVYLRSQLKTLRSSVDQACSACNQSLKLHREAIGCDNCLLWYHSKCVQHPSTDEQFWFCTNCISTGGF
ncbi:hypothetical protein CAPTEDRAFT_202722 [Capitella teleta]|uniref:PHD-type domain-containing protein n=1 Tax=Capitella teleta TaxID=283909 RepID=R7UNF5_CAPTE|nr:hypothetical protein CAPTEDRAFT_202722 [Capitella teleta]|eukprot:ELU05477.1 hypothetical protein CAPTEDRAFT_202722 [Capitella teleta]